MKAYLAIKYKEDGSNRELIEHLSNSLERSGISAIVLYRDHELWGKIKFNPQELMHLAFESIDASDVLIVEFSEKGVGLGIEAGYAHAKKKPVHVIAKTGSDISSTLRGLATSITFYNDPEQLDTTLILGE